MNRPDLYGRTPPFTSPADVARFRTWARDEDVRGVVMGRFLNGYTDQPHVDCWVYTEDLGATLAACLRAFEKQASPLGSSATRINWPALNAALQGAVAHHNPSSHGACEHYFDAALSAEVLHGFDAPLFDAFGWKGCCRSRGDRPL